MTDNLIYAIPLVVFAAGIIVSGIAMTVDAYNRRRIRWMTFVQLHRRRMKELR